MYLFFENLLQHVDPKCDSSLVAIAAAVLYGVHPAMAETVNYVIQRGDIYSTFGVVAALAMYARWPEKRRLGIYLLPFAFGLLSKPPAIVFPLLLFAYVAYFESDLHRPMRRAFIATVPAIVVGVALMLLQVAMTPKTYAPSTLSRLSYCITQPFVLLRYFGAFFLPIHLNVDTDLNAFDGITVNAIWGFVFLFVLIFIIWRTAYQRQLRPISYGLIWFLIASIPTSVYRLSEVENDHRMYMPFVGLALAVSWAVYLGMKQNGLDNLSLKRGRIAPVVLFLIFSTYAYGTHLRNRVWHSEESLWLDDIEKSPHNGRGLMIYGLTQMSKGAYPEALSMFQRARVYTPHYPILEINLGVVHAAMGHPLEAQQHFQLASALAPGDDQTHFYYGRWLLESGHLAEAVSELNHAVSLNPARLQARDLLLQALVAEGDMEQARTLALQTVAIAPSDAAAENFIVHPSGPDARFWVNVSLSRYQQRDFQGCIDAAHEALKLDARSELAYNNMGAAYAEMSNWKEAIEAEKQALALKPDFQLAKNNLASYQERSSTQSSVHAADMTPEQLLNDSLAFYQQKLYADSIVAARAALKLKPDLPEAWNNIAAAEASMQRWDEAISAADQAIRLRPDFQLAKNNRAWALAEKRKLR